MNEAETRESRSTRFRMDQFHSDLTRWNQLERVLWKATWLLLCRLTPAPLHRWRCFVLRCFGATIGKSVRFYGSAEVFLPRNLRIGDHCVVGPKVNLYCVAPIELHSHVMVSQETYLCAATHDHNDQRLPLVAKPILVRSHSWICARAFVGPGVTVGSDVVVGACAAVFRDVGDQQIVGGNPAKRIRIRDIDESTSSSAVD